MARRSRDDRLIYPFGVERDPLVVKVLCQVLYDELERSLRNCINWAARLPEADLQTKDK